MPLDMAGWFGDLPGPMSALAEAQSWRFHSSTGALRHDRHDVRCHEVLHYNGWHSCWRVTAREWISSCFVGMWRFHGGSSNSMRVKKVLSNAT